MISIGSGNWIVDNLNSALGTWNGKLAEIWTLLSTGPEEFKGGGVWSVIVGINDGLIQLSTLFNVSLDYLVLGKYIVSQAENTDVVQLRADIAELAARLNQFRENL